MTCPAIPMYEPDGNPLLADLLSGYPLHRVSDFCSLILERHGAAPQPRANPIEVRRQPEGKRGRRETPDADAHGFLSTYVNFKCRCGPCRGARAAYDRARRIRQREAPVCPSKPFAALGGSPGAESPQRAVQPPTAPTDHTIAGGRS